MRIGDIQENEFCEYFEIPEEGRLKELIYSATAAKAINSLNKRKLGLSDFLNLISPAAEQYLNELGRRANSVKFRRFGKTVKLYAPLYVSNRCRNSCVYCGFNAKNNVKRITLTFEQIEKEAVRIKNYGFDNILIVSGDAADVTIDYLIDTVKILKKYFSYIGIEVAPLEENQYAELVRYGLDGLTTFQETYNREIYRASHPTGSKKDYYFRLKTLERGGAAGVKDLGFGVLLGLYDWRIDAAFMFMHSRYIMKKYWRARINFSFPRICAAASGFQPQYPVTDNNLAQLLAALRICLPDAGLNLSTRERPALRDALLNFGITIMSAGSKTNPGGYTELSESETQFEVSDNRSPAVIAETLKNNNLDPVWKDWDNNFK